MTGGVSQMEAGTAPETGPVTVTASGELDVARSELTAAIDEALAGGAARIVVNLLDVSFIDSSVLQVLVLAHREVSRRNGWIRLVYTNHLIARVIDMTGLAEILPQYGTIDSALSGRTVGDDPRRAEEPHGS